MTRTKYHFLTRLEGVVPFLGEPGVIARSVLCPFDILTFDEFTNDVKLAIVVRIHCTLLHVLLSVRQFLTRPNKICQSTVRLDYDRKTWTACKTQKLSLS